MWHAANRRFPDAEIDGIHPRDRLDPMIGVQPRGKASDEVKYLFSSDFNRLPERVLRIIRRFIIANNYARVNDRSHRSLSLWNSLLVRLDVHDQDLTTSQKKKLGTIHGKIKRSLAAQAYNWKAKKLCRYSSKDKSRLVFLKEMKQIPHRTWEGQMCDEFSANTPNELDGSTEADSGTEAGSEDELNREKKVTSRKMILRSTAAEGQKNLEKTGTERFQNLFGFVIQISLTNSFSPT